MGGCRVALSGDGLVPCCQMTPEGYVGWTFIEETGIPLLEMSNECCN
jgi:hypothetical protein